MEPVPATGQNLNRQAIALLECFRDRRIELFPDELLINDLLRLTIAERPYGFKLEATRDAAGHADRATAFSLVLPSAMESLAAPPVKERPDGLGKNLLETVERKEALEERFQLRMQTLGLGGFDH